MNPFITQAVINTCLSGTAFQEERIYYAKLSL
jgi:hypothetical protein